MNDEKSSVNSKNIVLDDSYMECDCPSCNSYTFVISEAIMPGCFIRMICETCQDEYVFYLPSIEVCTFAELAERFGFSEGGDNWTELRIKA